MHCVNRRVLGFIFRLHTGAYYTLHGVVASRTAAHVYSLESIKYIGYDYGTWGHKSIGKWIIIYE